MFKLLKPRTIKEIKAKKEKPMALFLPYKCHLNSNTIVTKNNELLQVIRVGGFSFETADDDELDIKKNIRNSLLKSMATGNISLMFHTIRKKKQVIDNDNYSIDPTVILHKDFTDYLDDVWSAKYINSRSFFNELYISILYKADKQGVAILEYFIKKLQQSSSKDNWIKSFQEMYENIEEVSGRIITALKDYDAKLLGTVYNNTGAYCEILSFLSSLVNGGQNSPVIVPRGLIDNYLPTRRLIFDSRSLEIRGAGSTKYAGIISILEYGPNTYPGIFDGFLKMPFEFIMTQSFNFADRKIAIDSMQLQQNRLIQTGDKSRTQIAGITRALDMATSGEIGFGDHHCSILVIDEDLQSLENSLSLAVVELTNAGIQPIRERLNMEPAYWGQLPGNMVFVSRKAIINTLNMVSYASMHNYPLGKIKGNHWGEYVTILDTTSGTPFYFNFHVRDVGHTLIIGPTGAGKTVLMNFLAAQAQKFKPRTFFFDKDRGAEIFIRALNGTYTIIDPGKKLHFNPLLLDDNGENRTFLLEWLKILVTSSGEVITADEVRTLTRAVEGNFSLNKKDRTLRNIVPFLGMEGTNKLATRIAMWHSNGAYANVFDNIEDHMDLNSNRVFGFDMGEILKDPVSLNPILFYLFHRINISLDGSPTMIVLDEAWALIDNPIFGPKIKDWLKVLRKLNAFVIFATQSVEDAAKSEISDTLIQQTATQIFLPNLKATEIYRTSFMLSEREHILIKTIDPSSRYFLVKQGISAVIARINLNNMTNVLNILSGNAETVRILDGLREKYGDDPENWLDKFYAEAKKIHQ